MKNKVGDQQLDQDWIKLMEAARQMGMTPEEIRVFLQLSEKTTSESIQK